MTSWQSQASFSNLNSVPAVFDDGSGTEAVLALGSEGVGLRTLVAKACIDFFCIPYGAGDGVDSLNASAMRSILLWHLLNSSK